MKSKILFLLTAACLVCTACTQKQGNKIGEVAGIDVYEDTKSEATQPLSSMTRENVENFYGFTVGDHAYNWPLSIADFESEGFVAGSHCNKDEVLKHGYYWSGSFTRDLEELYIEVHNTSNEELPVSECPVVSVAISGYGDDEDTVFISPHGFTLGESMDDLLSSFEPLSVKDSVSNGNVVTVITIGKDEKRKVIYGSLNGVINDIKVVFE